MNHHSDHECCLLAVYKQIKKIPLAPNIFLVERWGRKQKELQIEIWTGVKDTLKQLKMNWCQSIPFSPPVFCLL